MGFLRLWALSLVVLLIAFSIFITARHVIIVRRRVAPPTKAIPGTGTSFFVHHPDPYILVVLGSGGHTKEMLLMLESGFGKFRRMHRRYLVSSGDKVSLLHMKAFEDDMEKLHHAENVGTYDAHVVTRARQVHQSLTTTPFSALASFLQVFPVLASRWKSKRRPNTRGKVPDLVLTNGPATGFFVGLMAHLLKLFYLAPESSMQVVYVESWARIRTLSLTGKLFYYTGIADVFLVQHEPVAKAYGVSNAGWLVVVPPRDQR